jgi:hypothetical protein
VSDPLHNKYVTFLGALSLDRAAEYERRAFRAETIKAILGDAYRRDNASRTRAGTLADALIGHLQDEIDEEWLTAPLLRDAIESLVEALTLEETSLISG